MDQLVETTFHHSLNSGPMHTVRGKSAGAFSGCGSFQWTTAVQALSLLCVTTACEFSRGNSHEVRLSGGRGSLAASLDYAITKEPEWIGDMFGADSRGTSLIRRLIKITNPNQKRPGPVTLALNERFMDLSLLQIRLAGVPLTWTSELEQLRDRVLRTIVSQPGREREETAVSCSLRMHAAMEPSLVSLK